MVRTYYISIAGLKLGLDAVTVGNVDFLSSLASVTEPHAKKALAMILEPLTDSGNPNSFAKKFEDHAIAVVRVDEADEKKAVRMAEAEVERSINVLRFYLSGIFGDPFFYRRSMGMEGTIHVGTTAWITVNEATRLPGISTSRRGAYSGYTLGSSQYEDMKKLHFEKVEALLRKPAQERSPLENSILTAIDLVGTAVNELMLRNGFLQCMFALEAALLKRRQRSKAESIANLIIALFKVQAAKRKKTYDWVCELYDIRSDIVHEGIDNVDCDAAFNAFRLVLRVIIALIPYTESVKTKGELRTKLNV